MNIKEKFDGIDGIDVFQRVDSEHPSDIYLGYDQDSRFTLLLISAKEPPYMASSQVIEIKVLKRKDNYWSTTFSLRQTTFQDIFLHFCFDIVESSRNVNPENIHIFITSRYKKWQNMLQKLSSELLSFNAIKGLLGELIVLKDLLVPLLGESKAVNAWIGPDQADQDFVFDESWVEVKAINSGGDTVTISSIEQLDSCFDGELVVIYLDKTSQSDSNSISINSYFERVYEGLKEQSAKDKLVEILLSFGYVKQKEYDHFLFKYNGNRIFSVTPDFPSLRRNEVPISVINAKYVISLGAISSFEKSQGGS
jgi:hypothetical protein